MDWFALKRSTKLGLCDLFRSPLVGDGELDLEKNREDLESDVVRDRDRFRDLERVIDLEGKRIGPLLKESDPSIDRLRDSYDMSERTDNSDNLSI